MRIKTFPTLVSTGLLCMLATAAQADERFNVQFPRGGTGQTYSETVRGYEVDTYRLSARRGQDLVVRLNARNPAVYFSIRDLRTGRLLANTANDFSRDRARVPLPNTGAYEIRVMQARTSARRGMTSAYSLAISVPPSRRY